MWCVCVGRCEWWFCLCVQTSKYKLTRVSKQHYPCSSQVLLCVCASLCVSVCVGHPLYDLYIMSTLEILCPSQETKRWHHCLDREGERERESKIESNQGIEGSTCKQKGFEERWGPLVWSCFLLCLFSFQYILYLVDNPMPPLFYCKPIREPGK